MTTLTDPHDLRELSDSVYSNFDHALEDAILQELEKGGCRAQHAGWNFCAWVWRENDEWHSCVMRYGSHAGTFHNQSVRALIDLVNEQFGRD